MLLNRFNEIAEQEGIKTAYIEAPETGDFQLLLANRLRKVFIRMRQSGMTTPVLRALRILKAFSVKYQEFSATIDVDPLIGQADSGLLAEDITDLLVGAGLATQSQGSGLLLSIDELQYLSSEELAALIVAIHRTGQMNLPVVLAGAGLPQLPGLAGEAKSYAERLFDFPEIDRLSHDDAAAALLIPAQAEGVEIERNALDRLVEAAHGYPYFLQEWGYRVWNLAPGSSITLGDVESAQDSVIRQLDQNFFLVRYHRLTPKEKEYLRAMAYLGPGPHRSGDIAVCLGVRVETVAPRRSGLITKGMIFSPAHGDTAFTVPLFDEYLSRVMPDWSPKL